MISPKEYYSLVTEFLQTAELNSENSDYVYLKMNRDLYYLLLNLEITDESKGTASTKTLEEAYESTNNHRGNF